MIDKEIKGRLRDELRQHLIEIDESEWLKWLKAQGAKSAESDAIMALRQAHVVTYPDGSKAVIAKVRIAPK